MGTHCSISIGENLDSSRMEECEFEWRGTEPSGSNVLSEPCELGRNMEAKAGVVLERIVR